MDLKFEITEKEQSNVNLKITVNQKEINEEYNKLLNDIQKQAQIDGFRRGKVPVSILETKFKKEFLADVSTKIIENALKEVLEKVEKKPISYSVPKLENFSMAELNSDYTFEVSYDIFPVFTISSYDNIEIDKEEVNITKDDINHEIEHLLKQQATIESKEGKIEKDDIAAVDYKIILDNMEFDKKENDHIYIGKNLNIYKLEDDIIGLKKDEEKKFEKTFSENDIEKLKGKTFSISLKINEVKHEVIPELTDELARQINEKCNTVEELKEKIKENMENYSAEILNNKLVEDAFKKIIETYKGPIPESMVSKQQEMIYQNFVYNTGGNEQRLLSILKAQNQTKETYFEKIKDHAIYNIKKGLIIDKIVKNEKLDATEDEINKFVEPMAEKYKMKSDEIIKMYKDAGNFEILKNDVETKKAVDYLKSITKVKKTKKIDYLDLFKQNAEE